MTVLKILIELKFNIFFVTKKNLRIKTRSVFHINITERLYNTVN